MELAISQADSSSDCYIKTKILSLWQIKLHPDKFG